MRITKMTIGNPTEAFSEFMEMPSEPFPPFTNPVEFKFDERVNLFIGPNATGKSTLLAKLFERLANGIEDIPAICSWGMLEFAESTRGVQAVRGTPGFPKGFSLGFDYEDPQRLFKQLQGTPLIAIPATRVPHISGKPVQRMFSGNTDRVIAGGFSQPFDGHDVNGIAYELQEEIERLCKEEQDYLFDHYQNNNPNIAEYGDNPYSDLNVYFAEGTEYVHAADNFQDAVNESYLCAREICSDIMAGDLPDDDTVMHRTLTEAGLPTVSVTLESGTRIKTVDPAQRNADAKPLHIRQLSDGTQGTFWWIRLIAFALLKAADYQNGWAQTRAVLLIDEIENHLHPTWQRRVIPALLEHFPGLQIFATTHSPFVVAGLKAGQVHLLNRDADGVITASTNDRDIIGWTADQILRTFMGVDEPTDQLTVDRSSRMRELYGKSSLTADEESELNDLRVSVSEDFPQNPVDPQLNAQRERYADMMQQFLGSRLSDHAPGSESV